MRLPIAAVVIVGLAFIASPSARQSQAAIDKGQRLEDLAWPEAERS